MTQDIENESQRMERRKHSILGQVDWKCAYQSFWGTTLAVLSVRLFIALWSISTIILSLVNTASKSKWPFFFTNLSYIGISIYFIVIQLGNL